MNMIICGENCRWQEDGFCILTDISRVSCENNRCCHFEKK